MGVAPSHAPDGVAPAHPLTRAESDALAGEGTIAAAIAAHGWRFVYCEHGAFPGDDWHEHTHNVLNAGHDIYAVERDLGRRAYIEDCVLILADHRGVTA